MRAARLLQDAFALARQMFERPFGLARMQDLDWRIEEHHQVGLGIQA